MPFRDYLLILVVCLAWGLNFVSTAQGMQHFSPFMFTALRFTLVLVVLVPFLRMPPRGQLPLLITVCLCVGALHFTTVSWALARSADVSSIAIAVQTYVPMSVILAVVLLGETVGWRSWLAISITFSGVAVLSFDPLILGQLDSLAIGLFSAFTLALGSTLMRRIQGVSTYEFQAWLAAAALPVVIAGSLWVDSNHWQMIRSAGWLDWAAVVYTALISSVVGYGAYYLVLQRHPVSSVMVYMPLTPLFAVCFGIALWGDRPGWRLYAGGALILAGILFISLRARQRRPAQSGGSA